MKVGLDIHGVLSDHEFMSSIIEKLKAEGHELYVISGAPKEELKVELIELGYQVEQFNEIYSIIDYLLDINAPGKIWHNEKGWWYDDDVRWWKIKAEICELHNIDVLIDDQEKYKQEYLKDKLQLYSWFNFLIKRGFFVTTALTYSTIGHGIFQLTPKSEIPIR